MRRRGESRVMIFPCLFILLVGVPSSISKKDFSKKINAEAYLYPDHFWQLDYSTNVEDVLESDSPTVHGDEQLKITGEGRGFLKYKAAVSSATLATLRSPCYTDVSKCRSGITYAFWFLLARVVTSSDGTYQLLSLKPEGYDHEDSQLRVLIQITNGQLNLNVISSASKRISVEKEIKAARWYHVIIEEKVDGVDRNMNVFLNLEELPVTTEVKDKSKILHFNKVDFFLGKAIDDNVSEAFQNAEICIDNLAIWKRTLNISEKTKIYFAEFGKIENILLTKNPEKPFEIQWNTYSDYYSQIESYTIKWKSGNEFPNTLVYRDQFGSKKVELQAYLEIFEPNKEYTVRIHANLNSGIQSPYVEKKFTILSDVKGSEVMVHSDTCTSIKMSWKVWRKDVNATHYTVAHNKTGRLIEDRVIRSKSLKYTLKDLIPNKMYQIRLMKEEDEVKYKLIYNTYVKTKAVVETMNTSVVSAKILNFTSNSVYLQFELFPNFWKYKLEYRISTRELYDPNVPAKISYWNQEADFVYIEVDRLKPFTMYSVDIEAKDRGYRGKGVTMQKPLIFRIKDFFEPPSDIKLLNASESSLTLGLTFPHKVISNGHVISRVNIYVSDENGKVEVREFKLDSSNKVITKLNQYTKYKVYAASGDGETFGKISKIFYFQTEDQNECLNKDTCEDKLCKNTLGSYQCYCTDGYVMINNSCQDKDECLNKDLCKDKLCKNTPGSYQCYCPDGYFMVNNSCQDQDECLNKDVCKGKLCKNTPGSYQCYCHDGYVMVKNSCQDQDECVDKDVCKDKLCKNTLGSYQCYCHDGYIMVNNSCQDQDECLDKDLCKDKLCKNTLGSYLCYCRDGYIMVNNSCQDKDECLNKDLCKDKLCKNIPGSYQCYCPDGYLMVNNSCQDKDECLNKDTCKDKLCKNTRGSYQCYCQDGYVMVKDSCQDKDECSNENVCKDKLCRNTPGSYHCYCPDGYVMVNNSCQGGKKFPVCREETSRNITWRKTFGGENVFIPCPSGATGNASRVCKKHINGTAKWLKPDLSGCVSRGWINIAALREKKAPPKKVANKLKTFVEEETLHGGDIVNIVGLLGSLVNEIPRKERNFVDIAIDVTSNLLGGKTKAAWNDLPTEKRSNDAGQLLETTDSLVESAAVQNTESKKSVSTQNIEISLYQIQPNDETSMDYLVGGNSIILPDDAVQSDGNPTTVAVAAYEGLSELIGVPRLEKNTTNYIVNSKVMSISLYPQAKETFTQPVVISMTYSQEMNDSVPVCVFWNEDKDRWSDEGCNVFSYNQSHVTCHCYHLTSFVVLMTVSDAHDASIIERHQFALGLITTIGIGISLLGLLASFFTFIFVRVIRSIRNTIHQHLVIALFLAQVVFLFGVERTDLHTGCQVIAAVIHYFFLVAFFIMGLEGVVLYFMLVRVYRSMGTSGYGSVKYVVWCWVLPIVFILINLIIDDSAYGYHSRYCWLSLRSGYIWSFVGPVLLIILSNFFILCMTLRVMTEKAKKRTSVVDEIWFWMKGSCLLISILGVTWVVGVFYVDQQTLFIAYSFNIINSLQGLSIFIFHCVCDPRVRKAYKQFFCCDGKKNQSLIRSNTRSTRMFSNASKSSIKNKKMSYSNGTSPAEVSLMSSPGGTSTPNDSFGILVGAKL